MTQDEVVTLKKLIAATAGYYGQVLSDMTLKMYAADLEDLPLDAVVAAYRTARRDKRNTRLPLPAVIREIVQPSGDDDHTIGVTVSGRIMEAIKRFGNYRSKEAREYIGDLGWRVVEMQGGWQDICQMNTDEAPIRMAQWRETAKAVLNRSRAGCLDEAPALPGPTNKQPGLQSFGSVMAGLLESKKPEGGNDDKNQ